MMGPSFLGRKTLGQPNFVLIAMGVVFLAALVPRGARLALESSVDHAAEWLPAGSGALVDLAWFGQQFDADAGVVRSLAGSETLADFVPVAGLAALVAFAVGCWCFHSLVLSGIIVATGAISAAASLAAVYYFGAIEAVMLGGAPSRLGVVDPLVILAPVVVFAAAVCGAVFFVNNYQTCRHNAGTEGAAEQAVRASWFPCALGTLALVAALSPLCVNEALPIQRFAIFTSLGLVVALGLLLTLVPVLLFCVPSGHSSGAFAWTRHLAASATSRPAKVWVVASIFVTAGVVGLGQAVLSPHVWNSISPSVDVPQSQSLEIVLAVPNRHVRDAKENPELDGSLYRLTIGERREIVREVENRLAAVSGLGPSSAAVVESGREFHCTESVGFGKSRSSRDLWRINSSVAAGADLACVMEQVRQTVDSVLLAIQQRSRIVARLHDAGKRLAGARLCILYRAPIDQAPAALGAQESILADLLQRSGLEAQTGADGKVQKALSSFNLAMLDARVDDSEYLEAAIKALGEQDALVLVSAGSDPTARKFAEAGVTVIDVSQLPKPDPTKDIVAVYTGAAPLRDEAQRYLPQSLAQSLMWSPLVMAAVLVSGFASPVGGMAAMLIIVAPVVAFLGGLGLLGIELDTGLAITACVLAVVAAGGACHFLSCYRRGLSSCLDRSSAVRLACERFTQPLAQSAVIVGFALAVLAMSDSPSLVSIGHSVGPVLAVVALAQLALLPALVSTPLGSLIGAPGVHVMQATAIEDESEDAEAETFQDEVTLAPVIECERVELPELVEQPVVPRAYRFEISDEEKADILAGPHGKLHAKLRSLRRELPPRGAKP